MSVRPPPSMMRVFARRSTAMDCAEIVSILLPRTRTLEGADSEAFLPSKMRTFWKSVVPPSAEGACCARLARQSPSESAAATVHEEHDARFDERIVRTLDEALKGIPEFIAHAPFVCCRVRLKRPDLPDCSPSQRLGINRLRRRSELTALIAPNDFERQEDRARGKQENAYGGEPGRLAAEAQRCQQQAEKEKQDTPELLDQEDRSFNCKRHRGVLPLKKNNNARHHAPSRRHGLSSKVRTRRHASASPLGRRALTDAKSPLRGSCRRLPCVNQPGYAVRYQIDTEDKSEHPETCRRESRQDDEAGQNSENAGQQHHPAGISPVAEAQQDSHDAGNQQQQAEDIGQDQSAGDGLAHQHGAERDVQNSQQHLPQESSPSLGPERVDYFERAHGDEHPADENRADNRHEHDVAQHQEPCDDHHYSKQKADPKRWPGQIIGGQTGTAVIGGHAILLNMGPTR